MSSLTDRAPLDAADAPWVKINPLILTGIRRFLMDCDPDNRNVARREFIRQIELVLNSQDHWKSLVGFAAE